MNPTYKLTIVANNEAGAWASWPAKIAAIQAFYAPVCTLDITVIPTHLTPQFSPDEPASGSSFVYRVDETWYEDNVLLMAEGADIVMFVVPPTDHTVVTTMGLAVYNSQLKETSVFSDETSHCYVTVAGQSVDQGETAVVYALHELSHIFYDMLAKTDNTHLYFFAGIPGKVLDDFDFNEQLTSWYQKLITTLQAEIAALRARPSTSTP
jgi:hypothetical protein